jgi:CRP/FNR family transcriptional regulator
MEDLLATIEPFDRLSAEARARLLAVSGRRRYAKGETIFRAGEPAEAVGVVLEGRVHLARFLEDGHASTLCVVAPGETFCCLPSLDRRPYPADAVAAADSTVLRIPLNAFHRLLQEQPAFLEGALCFFCERLRQAEGRACMVYESVQQRLARELLRLSGKFGPTIPLTKQELADLAHTTVETTIRVLSELKRRGILTSSRGATTIEDASELERLAGS